jgi:hypothetical protein
MAQSTGDNTKKRAAQKGTLIGVRLQPDQLAKLDAWIGQLPDAHTRPEAIRRLMEIGLAAPHTKESKIAAKRVSAGTDRRNRC